MNTLYLSLVALLFLSLAQGLTNPKCNTLPQGSIIPINSPCSPFRPKTALSWQDTVLQMQSNDKTRLKYLSTLAAGRSFVSIASGRAITHNPTYIVRLKIGTPVQSLYVAVDTSNDAAWIPCTGCVGCPSGVYNPAKSTTSSPLICRTPQCNGVPIPPIGFNITYGSSTISATLAQDNITLAVDSIPAYIFGCVRKVNGSSFPAQGLLGLGRGPLSLLSQTTSLYQSTFSYCLPSYNSANFTGSLRLGPSSQPVRIKTTPLLRNPRRSTFYYVSLLAIRVGARVVTIPPSAFAFDPNTGAGTVFDSGTVFTSLVKPAYVAVRDEFRRRMGRSTPVSSLGGFDTCYTVPITIPTITFMFSGMNVTLPQENFIIHSSAGTISCLAMAAAPDTGVNSVLNVIASFQQQNHRIFIDGANSKLGVVRELCS